MAKDNTPWSERIIRQVVNLLLSLCLLVWTGVIGADLWAWFMVPLSPAVPALTPLQVIMVRVALRALFGGRGWQEVELSSALVREYVTDGPWVRSAVWPLLAAVMWGLVWCVALLLRDYGHLLPFMG